MFSGISKILALLALISLPCYAQFGGYSSDLPFMGVDTVSTGSTFDANSIAGLMFWHKAEQRTIRGTNSLSGRYTKTGVTNGEAMYASANLQSGAPAYTALGNYGLAVNDLFSSGGASTFYYSSTGGPNGSGAFYHTNTALDNEVWQTAHSGVESVNDVTNQPTYYFMLVSTWENSTAQRYLFTGATAGTTRQIAAINATTSTVILWDNMQSFSSTNAPNWTNWTVLTACFNGANSFIRTNGVTIGHGTTGTYGVDRLQMFCDADENIDFPGAFSEFIGYGNVTLTTNEIQQVESYMMSQLP